MKHSSPGFSSFRFRDEGFKETAGRLGGRVSLPGAAWVSSSAVFPAQRCQQGTTEPHCVLAKHKDRSDAPALEDGHLWARVPRSTCLGSVGG